MRRYFVGSFVSFLVCYLDHRLFPPVKCLCFLVGDHVESVSYQLLRFTVTILQHFGTDPFRASRSAVLESAHGTLHLGNVEFWNAVCLINIGGVPGSLCHAAPMHCGHPRFRLC